MMNHLRKRYLIITHTYATGPSQELRDYFIKNKVSFAFLEHPFIINNNAQNSTITYYDEGKEIKKIIGGRVIKTDWICFVKDLFESVLLVVKLKKKYDICIAADNLNTTAAILLKKLGLLSKVVYYTIDYSPKRFDSRILNTIYLFIDRWCCYHSDLVWSSSARMRNARIKTGLQNNRHSSEMIVHDGCHFNQIKRLSDNRVTKEKVVFMGHLVPNKGVDLIIKAYKLVLKKIPEARLIIVGGGSEEKNLKMLAGKMKLQGKVTFTGYLADHAQVEKTLSECGVAVAPYVPDPNSFSFYSDVGKVKVYLACGLPVLITDVPEIAKEIRDNKAGMIIDYSESDLANKICELISNKKTYFCYRKNAINMARNLDWDNVWEKSLLESLKFLDN